MAMQSYKSVCDGELVEMLRSDDHGAYTELYDRYADRLYTHVRTKLRDREDAKDVVQEVFTALWNNREGLKPQASLLPYLFAAVRYKVINLLLQRNLHAKYIDAETPKFQEEPTASDHLVRERELQQLINDEVSRLPKKMREVFCLSRDHYLSHREIAERMELSEATVKKQVNNALKVLRLRLGTLLSIALLFIS